MRVSLIARSKTRTPAALVAAAAAAVAIGAPAFGQIQVPTREVVLIGDTVPGSTTETFTFLSRFHINDAGSTAFEGTVSTGGARIWLESAGTFTEIVRINETVPGTGGARFFQAIATGGLGNEINIANPNLVAFAASTNDTATMSTGRLGWWFYQSGTKSKLIEIDDTPSYLSGLAVNRIGVPFQAGLSTNAGGPFLLTGRTSGSRDFVVETDGTNYSTIIHADSGEDVGAAFLTTGDDPMFVHKDTPAEYVYFGSPDVTEGDAVPGAGSGSTFDAFSTDRHTSSSSGYAFYAEVNAVGSPAFDRGIFRYLGGVGELVAYDGMAAPGTSDTFDAFFLSPDDLRMNEDGDIAFVAQLDASSDLGVWKMDAGGSLELVAVGGQSAPGASGVFTNFDPPQIVEDGQVIFFAATSTGTLGFWATDHTGVLEKVLTDEDTIGITSRCDARNITLIEVGSFEAEQASPQGQSTHYNQQGEIAARISFASGTGGAGGRGLFVIDSRNCAADFNGDGVLDIFDFIAFNDAVGMADPAADWNCDGSVDIFDFLEYQTAFGKGCW